VKRSACLFALLAILTSLSASANAADPLLAPTTVCRPGASTEMLCLHNWARKQAGVGVVVRDQRVVDSANTKANGIIGCKQFSHTPCDELGAIPNVWWGENISFGYTIRVAFDLWLRSPGHRANILNGLYTKYGSAYRPAGVFPRLWVIQFASN
jgi:uncharacterized protein YkwD